jgi:hypothetical protein
MPVKKEVAKKYGVEEKDLVAVIYYSDRSYSKVVVYGTQFKKIEQNIKASNVLANQTITGRGWSELKVVPEEGHIVDAASFGLEAGKKLLLVSGHPPTET